MGEKNLQMTCPTRGLISKIYKELIQLNMKKANNPVTKCIEHLNRRFSKEHIELTNRHMKDAQDTNHQGNANQNHEISSHIVRMATVEKTRNNKCWRVSEEKEILFVCLFLCSGSSFLWSGFLQLTVEATLCCSVWTSLCSGVSCCGVQALGA